MRKMLLATAALVGLGNVNTVTAGEPKCVEADDTKWCMGMVTSVHPRVLGNMGTDMPDFWHRFHGSASESVSLIDHIDTGIFGDIDIYAPAMIRRTGWLNTGQTGLHKIRLVFEGPKVGSDFAKAVSKARRIELENLLTCRGAISVDGSILNSASFELGVSSSGNDKKALAATFRKSSASPTPFSLSYTCQWSDHVPDFENRFKSTISRSKNLPLDQLIPAHVSHWNDIPNAPFDDTFVASSWFEPLAYQSAKKTGGLRGVAADVSVEIAHDGDDYSAPKDTEVIFSPERHGQIASSIGSLEGPTVDGDRRNLKAGVAEGLRVEAYSLPSSELTEDPQKWDATDWHTKLMAWRPTLPKDNGTVPDIIVGGEKKNGHENSRRHILSWFRGGNLMDVIHTDRKPDDIWSSPSGSFSTNDFPSRAGVRDGGKLKATGHYISDKAGRHTFAVVIDGNPGEMTANDSLYLNACSARLELGGRTVVSGEEILRAGGGVVFTGGANLKKDRFYDAEMEMACRLHGKGVSGRPHRCKPFFLGSGVGMRSGAVVSSASRCGRYTPRACM
ncbi:hypothetical protein, partial [Rhodovibrio sodomensis]|uniref:hypothetical protein n=1 Tax=Rhodovibrio sodomensis TaxID=1088 RepID=UPI001906D4EE